MPAPETARARYNHTSLSLALQLRGEHSCANVVHAGRPPCRTRRLARAKPRQALRQRVAVLVHLLHDGQPRHHAALQLVSRLPVRHLALATDARRSAQGRRAQRHGAPAILPNLALGALLDGRGRHLLLARVPRCRERSAPRSRAQRVSCSRLRAASRIVAALCALGARAQLLHERRALRARLLRTGPDRACQQAAHAQCTRPACGRTLAHTEIT